MERSSEPLVTPEVAAKIGQEIYRAHGTVDHVAFQRWAAAVGDLNPIYFDDLAAIAAGYRGMTMPPLYVRLVCAPINSVGDLNPDGSQSNEPTESLPLAVKRLMAGGDDLEIFEPVYPGDRITAICKIASVTERQGKTGPFVVADFKWDYTNQAEMLVARSCSSIIIR